MTGTDRLDKSWESRVVDATIVVVCFNAREELVSCLAALVPSLWRQVILVDNSSLTQSMEVVSARWPEIVIVRSDVNLGFAGGANLGARHATGSVLIFLNPDTRPQASVLQSLVERLRAAPGVAGPTILHERVDAPEAGALLDILGMPRSRVLADSRLPLYVSGCCLATNRSCFEQVGGFDARYFMFTEDVEYCWQALRHGFTVSLLEDIEVSHLGGAVAPGGYRSGDDQGYLEISPARVLLRERNTTTMLIACSPVTWLPAVVILSVVRTAAFAWLLARLGAYRSICGLFVGLCQIIWWIPETLRRRWRHGTSRGMTAEAWRRVVRRPFLLDHFDASHATKLVGVEKVSLNPNRWKEAVGVVDNRD